MHSRQLSFSIPILVSLVGILLSFVAIAAFITAGQRNEMLEEYHSISWSEERLSVTFSAGPGEWHAHPWSGCLPVLTRLFTKRNTRVRAVFCRWLLSNFLMRQ